jgi:AcrR family transcriptional regulator
MAVREEFSDALVRPARGTRPSNRRELIVRAAADLFYRDGYANVGMKDIADAVAIGPSALYRHFRNKQDLLYVVVSDVLSAMERIIKEVREDPSSDLAGSMAAGMLERRPVGVLWQREARQLADTARIVLRRRIRTIGGELAGLLRRERPELEPDQADLLAWSMLGVATSVSFHRLELPAGRLAGLLADMVNSVIGAETPALLPVRPDANNAANSWAPSRSEAILATATTLFAERGFASVGIDDIGAAVGISGPSIYYHFSGKAEILAEAMLRGNDMLRTDMYREIGRAADPADALHRLMGSYSTFAFENVDLMRLLRSEPDQLLPHQRHQARAAQQKYISEWVQLLRQVHPEFDAVEARVRVQGFLNMINDTAATPHLHAFANVTDALVAIGANLLNIGSGDG